MPGSTPAEAVQNQQQRDTQRLLERFEQLVVADLTVNYTLQKSSVVLPGVLLRFLTLAVLFRLNSAKKWRLALDDEFLPEPLRRWLGIQGLTDLVEQIRVGVLHVEQILQLPAREAPPKPAELAHLGKPVEDEHRLAVPVVEVAMGQVAALVSGTIDVFLLVGHFA